MRKSFHLYVEYINNFNFATTAKTVHICQRIYKEQGGKRGRFTPVNLPSIPTTWKVLLPKLKMNYERVPIFRRARPR